MVKRNNTVNDQHTRTCQWIWEASYRRSRYFTSYNRRSSTLTTYLIYSNLHTFRVSSTSHSLPNDNYDNNYNRYPYSTFSQDNLYWAPKRTSEYRGSVFVPLQLNSDSSFPHRGPPQKWDEGWSQGGNGTYTACDRTWRVERRKGEVG